ncbi:MAG: SON protein [Desulfovibrio sp.]|nr:SON protein [Desulfovibrio sp.]MBR5051405.1 SON protein [Desulfovibrio sp.]MBR6467781.1 SON protein [Desulfovibrio sp.]
MRKLLLAGFMAFGLCACAPSNQPQLIDPAQPEQTFPGPEEPCDKVYTFAPGSFIVELAPDSENEVVLEPSLAEFRLFCTPEAARAYVDKGMAEGTIQKGDWKIYQLQGSYSEIGKAKAPGEYILAKQTVMVDWVREAPKTKAKTKGKAKP